MSIWGLTFSIFMVQLNSESEDNMTENEITTITHSVTVNLAFANNTWFVNVEGKTNGRITFGGEERYEVEAGARDRVAELVEFYSHF